ncbi:hypothetical protein FDP41_000183 [Naegleria fowleri]|uniref:SART-1 family protein n=1 Tax=Naegleria fowleri TaxID=5763 RepID=A0A6A5CEX5_NAEFO|nr:uncharacterized protein FDP41_000183 [Naegleria fowleri]KAF0985144.1 hypothetical protein FDP41_000183 [Naegleria fowleri]
MHVANDGSFYLSIEETNEIRKKLGLKPLNVTNQTTTSASSDLKDEPKNEEDEASEVHKRIELAKIKRKERELKRIKGEDDEEDIKPTVVKKEKQVILETNEDDEEIIQKSSKSKFYDLHASKPSIASDFEVVKKKKAKNIRVKDKLSEPSATSSGTDLLAMMELNASMLDEEIKPTSRAERTLTRREENILLEEREKDRSYQEAIDKAHEQSKILHQSFTPNFESNREEDFELNYNQGKKYDATKHFVKTISIEKSANEEEETVINKRKRKSQSLRTKDADGDHVMEETSQTTTVVPTIEVKKEEEPQILQEEIIKEPLVSDGLLATLEFAKQQGFLEDKRVGRNKDKSHIEERQKSKLLDNNEDIDFVIEHLDQYGRATTPKQAYINFSHSYHGNKPKKKKVAKEKKKMELERRRNAGALDDSMKVLETVMKETKQPFVEITKETFEKAVEIRAKLQKESKPKKKKQKKEDTSSVKE